MNKQIKELIWNKYRAHTSVLNDTARGEEFLLLGGIKIVRKERFGTSTFDYRVLATYSEMYEEVSSLIELKLVLRDIRFMSRRLKTLHGCETLEEYVQAFKQIEVEQRKLRTT